MLTDHVRTSLHLTVVTNTQFNGWQRPLAAPALIMCALHRVVRITCKVHSPAALTGWCYKRVADLDSRNCSSRFTQFNWETVLTWSIQTKAKLEWKVETWIIQEAQGLFYLFSSPLAEGEDQIRTVVGAARLSCLVGLWRPLVAKLRTSAFIWIPNRKKAHPR